MSDKIEIRNNSEKSSFELFLNDVHAGEIDYEIRRDKILLTHTGVRQEHEGKGLARKLVEFAVSYARENELKVQPICPYIKKVFERNQEYQDLL
ncbi:MAG: GNAT family N-acetyltransferase [Bacteroidales bacterium]|jgi:predicted GNAT family acetyltransferase|nr:GNAT family N-acetyltransferase [Bacteroidales bacterium]